MARRLPENQFRRLHLNQWTTGRDVAFPEGVWAEAKAEMERAASLTRNARERELLLERAAACARAASS